MQRAAALGRWLAALLLAVLVTGCMDADIAIRFDNANHGQLTERIILSDRLLALAPDELQDWTAQVRRQVRPWGGTVKVEGAALTVSLPFDNQQSLEERFNQLLALPGRSPVQQPPVQLTATRDLNWVVAQRNRLTLDVDLRSLQRVAQGKVQLRRLDRAIGGKLQVVAPNPITVVAASSSVERRGPNHLTWQVMPDRPNHLDIAFWVPSPLGIGTILIAVLVTAGIILRPIFPL